MDSIDRSVPGRSIRFLEQVVLTEVSGKNAAIHAYDGMIWKIRTGSLTLLFFGWGVLLKSVTDEPPQASLLLAMFCFSCGLALGGWLVDRTCTRRKFRVIIALDRLLKTIKESPDQLNSIPAEVLSLAGDNVGMPFRCHGYQEAVRDGICVFSAPIIALVAAIYIVLR
jgi:hypothetical protein